MAFGLWGAPTRAGDGGELSLKAMQQHELAFVRYPDAAISAVSPRFMTYLPRFGAELAYGVSNWLELHIGGGVSLSRSVSASGSFQGMRGTLDAEYWDILLPIGLTAKWDRGTRCSFGLRAAVGPAFVNWNAQELKQLDDPDRLYPVKLRAAWHQQWLLQLGALAQWRPFDNFAFTAGPQLTRKSSGDLHLGIAANVELLAGAGPSF